ncbi:MAG TPA: hypothetical protein VJ917_10155 [Saprospiraceae bacterium]|nr:hypothetical protein [Saprospiraceae bacterium]
MTAALFSDYISGKQSVDNLGFEELKTLVIQYPYCRQLRYLLAQRELDEHAADEKNRSIQLASISANNRKAFFSFISKKKRAFTKAVINLVKSIPGITNNVEKRPPENKVARRVTVISNRKQIQAGIEKKTTEPTVSKKQIKSEHVPQHKIEEAQSDFIQWLKKLKKAQPKGAPNGPKEEPQPVISETLARLLVRQGKQQEALRMINQLILLNPEKKAYFASLIEGVNKES